MVKSRILLNLHIDQSVILICHIGYCRHGGWGFDRQWRGGHGFFWRCSMVCMGLEWGSWSGLVCGFSVCGWCWVGFLCGWWFGLFLGFWFANAVYLNLCLPPWMVIRGSQPRTKGLVLCSQTCFIQEPYGAIFLTVR